MNDYITKDELEQLIDAYFDCQLTRSEEADLRKVLAFTEFSSPAITAAKAAMGVEVAAKRHSRRNDRLRPRKPWLSIAASLAVLAVIGITAILYSPTSSHSSIEVYYCGHKISDPAQAERLAKAEIEKKQQFMQEMLLAERTRLKATSDLAEAAYYSDLHNLQLK